jgi:hypothetical protein
MSRELERGPVRCSRRWARRRAARLLSWSLLCAGLLASAARAGPPPIVYSRCPRHHQPFTITGPLTKDGTTTTATAQIPNGDLVDVLPDTLHSTSGFVAPCDLVYRDGQGNERILYSCIAGSTPASACAALDAAVSFDARTVAFSVFHGTLLHPRLSADGTAFDPAATNLTPFYVDAPGYRLVTTDAQIVLADLASGEVTPLAAPAGTYNFAPTWSSDGRILFSSSGRRDIYGPTPLCVATSSPSVQLYAMDPDGRNVELVSPHALAAELHPLQLADGRVAVSSWQEFGLLAYRHGNSISTCGPLSNFFHVFTQNPDGSGATAFFGQHVGDPTAAEAPLFGPEQAAHFFGQSSDGRLWKANYWRGDNLGLGSIEGFPAPPPGEEGPSVPEAQDKGTTPYRAPGEVTLALWASNADEYSPPMPAPPLTVPGYAQPLAYAGKLSHPSGLPGNALLLTWGQGPCSQNAGLPDVLAMQHLAATAGDNPACDTGIYMTNALPADTSNPVGHPSQLTLVVNSPDYHELLARPALPYQAVHGVAAPALIPRAELRGDPALEVGTPFGIIAASSLLHRETHPAGPITFNAHPPPAAQVGTDTVEYGDAELCGVRILAVYSNRRDEAGYRSTSALGERVGILGEFPVRNFDGAGQPVTDALGLQDTSFKVRIPADTPYLMQGIDCAGRTLNSDMTWQSVRPGEVKTCNGCHVHSEAAKALPFAGTLAGRGQTSTVLLGGGSIPLLTGGSGTAVTQAQVPGFVYLIEFERDIWPILQNRCTGCHAGAGAAAGLRLDLARDWSKVQANSDDSTYARLVLDPRQSFVPAALQFQGQEGTTLAKPNLSKYVRMGSSRGSLLYWKALGQRTDGHADTDRSDDVDFGPDHPTSATADELGLLARWIDTGSGWGPDFTADGAWPALHLVAVASGRSITALRVGAIDVGSGLDVSTLRVCVSPGAAGPCGPNLAGPADVHGAVAALSLPAPLSELDAEVWASVKDLSGHLTEQHRTVRFLLGLPPAEPGAADGGSGDGGTDAGPGDGGTGHGGSGCGCSPGARPGLEWALAVPLLLLLLQRRARRPRAARPPR